MQLTRCDSKDIRAQDFIVLTPCYGFQSSVTLCLFFFFFFVNIIVVLSPEQEKAMAPHSSTLAWKIPWTEEPGGLQSMGLLRVGHD